MKRFLLIATLAAAALLRFGGLSHDLADGQAHHPDVPKQIRTIEGYFRGNFYNHIGLSDYDGYPFGASYLTYLVTRTALPAVQGARALIGLDPADPTPSFMVLVWVFLLLNATLATVAVGVVYRLGSENFGAKVGLAAAALLAFSPADIAACHYATGDTGAAFFALLSVLFAFRIQRRGLWIDYILAAFCATCAFACKYHAGMAAFVAMAAHLARFGLRDSFATRDSWKRIGVLAAVGIGSLWIAIPALRTHAVAQFKDIQFFLTHVSSDFRLPDHVRGSGFAGKFAFSMERNLPILLALCGPAAWIAMLGAFRGWRRAGLWLLLVVPAVYFAVGVSMRPLSHPTYHTLMTPMLFLLAASGLAQVRQVPHAGRWIAVALAAWSGLYLGNAAWREVFFFRRQDTRQMTARWAAENIPPTYMTGDQRYGIPWTIPKPPLKLDGAFVVSPSLRPQRLRDDHFVWTRFCLESNSVPFFRNASMELYVHRLSTLGENPRLPVDLAIPSRTGNDVIFTDVPAALRSDRVYVVSPGSPLGRVVNAPARLERAVVLVEAGNAPAWAIVSFGGRRHIRLLQGGEKAVLDFDRPCRLWPRVEDRSLYELDLASSVGRVRCTLATDDAAIGRAYARAGRPADAVAPLARAALAQKHPTLAAEALLAAAISGVEPPDAQVLRELAAPLRRPLDAASVKAGWGVAPAYYDLLPYLEEELRGLADDTTPARIVVGPWFLPPGCYTARIELPATRASGECARVVASWRPEAGAPRFTATCDRRLPVAAGGNVLTMPLSVGLSDGPVLLEFRSEDGLPPDEMRVTLRPDILGTLRSLAGALAVAERGGPQPGEVAPVAFGYDTLLALATLHEAKGRPEQVSACRAAAAQIRPDAVRPREASVAVPFIASPAAYDRGLKFEGLLLDRTTVRRGGALGIGPCWTLTRFDEDPGGFVTFVHFKDAAGKTVFQADHPLLTSLGHRRNVDSREPALLRIPVDAAVPPGAYTVEIGLYDPYLRRRLPVERVEGDKKRVTSIKIPVTIRVE